MRWKYLVVLLIVILLASGCAEKSQGGPGASAAFQEPESDTQDTEKTGNSEEGVHIDSVVFSRAGGALLTLKDEAELSEIRVYSESEEIASQEIGKNKDNVFVSFSWDPEARYRFEVITGSGASGTIEAYAPPSNPP